ncbi:uncharacterized protein METZ01_LOCUS408386, partial [marine metagenome]
ENPKWPNHPNTRLEGQDMPLWYMVKTEAFLLRPTRGR